MVAVVVGLLPQPMRIVHVDQRFKAHRKYGLGDGSWQIFRQFRGYDLGRR